MEIKYIQILYAKTFAISPSHAAHVKSIALGLLKWTWLNHVVVFQ